MNFKIKNKRFSFYHSLRKGEGFTRLFYRSLVFLGFLFLFFIINSNSVLAADFKTNVGSTEWKINSDGIYKDDIKIACSDIQVGSIPDDGFLVKNSSGTKLFLIAEDSIYVSAKDSFASLTYPDTITNSFILKKSDNDVLIYVDGDGLHYKEGICDGVSCIPISTCEQLQMIGNDPNYSYDGDYCLQDNIDCSDTVNWNGGVGFDPIDIFIGTFDGNGFTISGLYIHRDQENIGLFSYLGSGSEVFNLTLDNFTVSNEIFKTKSGIGTLAGLADGSYIYDCSVINSSIKSYWIYTGGLVGKTENNTEIERCSSIDNSVVISYGSHGNDLGGLVGSHTDGSEINQCFSNSTIDGYDSIGGLVGYMSSASISNSYSLSNIIDGRFRLGGLVGDMGSGSILNCYSASNKALVADKEGGTISASYYNADLASDYGVYGEPRTTSQMTVPYSWFNTYEDWDFNNIWKNDEILNHYPCLQWQDGNCYAYVPLVCGNGSVDPGEECESDSDCGSPLKMCENCMCVDDPDACEDDSDCISSFYKCDNFQCIINYDCETSADCDTRFDPGQYACQDCVCTLWNPYGHCVNQSNPSCQPGNYTCTTWYDSGGTYVGTINHECNGSGCGDGYYCNTEVGSCNGLSVPRCECMACSPESRPAGNCGGPGPGCFSKGMKVYTPNGHISIEDIKVGDRVYSYNENTGKLEESRVGKVFVHEDFKDPSVRLVLSNGILLNSTLNHPFYSLEHEKYWSLESFNIGDKVLFYNDKIGQFEEVKILEFKKVDYFYYEYSLHLDGLLNNYFVNGIIVHNAGDQGDKGGDDPNT